ncbi:hypothetical protein, partial [Rhodoblastus sp.]|uniref:hypothetical protein n=1 Tax=Rhodoblastus sp. TaxID=1962975 RepID=UPI003F9E1588
CGSPCERLLAADDPAVLDRASHADNTRVDRGDPAIAVLSIGYPPSRLTPPRSGLERSDFVLRRFAAVANRDLERLHWARKRTYREGAVSALSGTSFSEFWQAVEELPGVGSVNGILSARAGAARRNDEGGWG